MEWPRIPAPENRVGTSIDVVRRAPPPPPRPRETGHPTARLRPATAWFLHRHAGTAGKGDGGTHATGSTRARRMAASPLLGSVKLTLRAAIFVSVVLIEKKKQMNERAHARDVVLVRARRHDTTGGRLVFYSRRRTAPAAPPAWEQRQELRRGITPSILLLGKVEG